MSNVSRWSDRVSYPQGRPRDFAQLDMERIESLVAQLGGDHLAPQKVTRKIALSLAGPSVEFGSESGPNDSPPLKVERLIRLLQKAGLLSHHRPIVTSTGPDDPQFILEKMVATPVIMPVSGFPTNSGVRSFRIWVSDPDPLDHDGPEWSFRGSFVILTELIFDDRAYTSVYSGCSALRFIVNAASNRPFLDRRGNDEFGRESNRHPIQKLQSVGGSVGDPRIIEALYRVRYMTDEQVYIYGDSEHRVHDVLGYPLFISW